MEDQRLLRRRAGWSQAVAAEEGQILLLHGAGRDLQVADRQGPPQGDDQVGGQRIGGLDASLRLTGRTLTGGLGVAVVGEHFEGMRLRAAVEKQVHGQAGDEDRVWHQQDDGRYQQQVLLAAPLVGNVRQHRQRQPRDFRKALGRPSAPGRVGVAATAAFAPTASAGAEQVIADLLAEDAFLLILAWSARKRGGHDRGGGRRRHHRLAVRAAHRLAQVGAVHRDQLLALAAWKIHGRHGRHSPPASRHQSTAASAGRSSSR